MSTHCLDQIDLRVKLRPMSDVFISYARGTALTHARALRDMLVNPGRGVFFDEREIPYGGEIPQEIAEGLMAARVAVAFLDERYFMRPYCIHEFQVITASAIHESLGDDVQAGHLAVALLISNQRLALCIRSCSGLIVARALFHLRILQSANSSVCKNLCKSDAVSARALTNRTNCKIWDIYSGKLCEI